MTPPLAPSESTSPIDPDDIVIDPEFAKLIPPPSPDERERLENLICIEGCREPLLVWPGGGNLLIDGHNRREICLANSISFKITPIEFASRDDAKRWTIENQLARRNISDVIRAELAEKLHPVLAGKAKSNQKAGGGDQKSGLVNRPNPIAGPVNTRNELAKIAGVSPNTIRKVKTILSSPVKELHAMARADEVSVDAAAKVAKLPEEMQRAAVAAGPAGVKAAAKTKARKHTIDVPDRVGSAIQVATGHIDPSLQLLKQIVGHINSVMTDDGPAPGAELLHSAATNSWHTSMTSGKF